MLNTKMHKIHGVLLTHSFYNTAFILSPGKQNPTMHIKMLHATLIPVFIYIIGLLELIMYSLSYSLTTSFLYIPFFCFAFFIIFLLPLPYASLHPSSHPSHSAPLTALFIGSKWSKEDALFLKEQEKEMGEEGRVGGFVKKRKIETERGEERERCDLVILMTHWHPTAFSYQSYLCVSPCPCVVVQFSCYTPPPPHIHTSTTSSTQRYRQAPQSHGPFGGAGVFLRRVNEHGLLSFPL